MKKRWLLLFAAVLLLFSLAVTRLETGRAAEGKEQLETVIRRTAVSCYAAEGFYPPSVDYMRTHWGLQYDEDRYVVRYEIFAANLMPEITVLEK